LVKKLNAHKQRPLEVQLGLPKAYPDSFAKSKAVRVFGSLALYGFAEMIGRKYQEKELDFLLCEQELPLRNEALLDVVTRRPACFFGKLVSAQT
jgi:hypothetical protein